MESVKHVRCAGIVLLLNICLLMDGISFMELTAGTPKGMWRGNEHTFPPGVQFASAVGITFYGLLGVGNSCYALLAGRGSALVTMIVLGISFVLGWFFFIVQVLATYPFEISRATMPIATLTAKESHSIIAMAMLVAIGTGVPVLAAQFYFTLQLARFQADKAQVYTAEYSLSRAFFYAGLMGVRAIGEIAAGSITYSHLGHGRLAMSVPVPPLVITFPSMAIADGVLVLVTALAAVVIALLKLRAAVLPFAVWTLFAFTAQLAMFSVTQVGINAANPLILGPLTAALSFVMFFTPAYLLAEFALVPNYLQIQAKEHQMADADAEKEQAPASVAAV